MPGRSIAKCFWAAQEMGKLDFSFREGAEKRNEERKQEEKEKEGAGFWK